jgi:hypothetical protein
MKKVVGSLAMSEVGITDPAVNLFVDQLSQGIRSIANLQAVRQFAGKPNNTFLFNEVGRPRHRGFSRLLSGV